MALGDDTLDMPSERPRIMIRVTEEELAELEEAAKEEYRTVPAFVLVLVRKYLDDRRAKTPKLQNPQTIAQHQKKVKDKDK